MNGAPGTADAAERGVVERVPPSSAGRNPLARNVCSRQSSVTRRRLRGRFGVWQSRSTVHEECPPSTTSSRCSTWSPSRSTSSAGAEPGRGPPAGVRRPGGRPGPGGGRPHRRASATCTRCTPTSCAPATRRADPLRGRPHPRRPAASPPAASSPSSTAGRSSTCPCRSTSRRTASTTSCRCPDAAPTRRRCPTSGALGPVPGRSSATGTTGPARSTSATSIGRRCDAQAPQRAVPARVAARRRHPARRSGAARLRAHLRLRHDAARHDAAAARRAWCTATDVLMASLDHAMWFHRPFRADEWLLYAQDTPSARPSGRGLGRRPRSTPRRHPRRLGDAGGSDPADARTSRPEAPTRRARDGCDPRNLRSSGGARPGARRERRRRAPAGDQRRPPPDRARTHPATGGGTRGDSSCASCVRRRAGALRPRRVPGDSSLLRHRAGRPGARARPPTAMATTA